MSNLKKIYDIETTPPEGMWNRIANELDAAQKDQKLSKRLLAAEQTPPPIVWNHISEALDEIDQNKKWAKKVYDAEVPAPTGLWEQIEKELDDQKALEIIEKKLSDMQVTPPAAAWTRILHELEGRKKTPALVVPIHHKWLKVTAAACFIAIISSIAFFVLKDSGGSGSYTARTNTNNGSRSINNIVSTNSPVPNNAATSQQQAMAGIRTKLGSAYTASNERNADLQNRYIILMTQDGNVVRMSKKLSNMADCIAGEDNSCDDQISKWQKEMASSNAAASPDNFLDILDMASTDATDGSTNPNM